MKIRVVMDFTVGEDETEHRGEKLLKIVKDSIEETFNEDPGVWELKSIKFVDATIEEETLQCPKCLGEGSGSSREQFRSVPCDMCEGTGVIKRIKT